MKLAKTVYFTETTKAVMNGQRSIKFNDLVDAFRREGFTESRAKQRILEIAEFEHNAIENGVILLINNVE